MIDIKQLIDKLQQTDSRRTLMMCERLQTLAAPLLGRNDSLPIVLPEETTLRRVAPDCDDTNSARPGFL